MLQVYEGNAGAVACATDDILSSAVCTLTTSRGIKTLTHLKRPPGLRGVLREDPRAGFPLIPLPRVLSSLPILRCSYHPPFSVPPQTTTPIAPPSFSFLPPSLCPPASPSRLPPHLSTSPAALSYWISHTQTYPRHLVTLFSSAPTATGLILRPLSRLQPLPLSRCSFSLLFVCPQTVPNIFP